MAERIKIEQLTNQIATLTEEIGRQKEIEQTKENIIRDAIIEDRQRHEIKKHPKWTFERRWQLLGRPHIDIRCPWTEVATLKTKTGQPEHTPRCVIQEMNGWTTPKELEEAFAKYGPVQETQITHSEDKKTIHYATVTFVNIQDARTAQKCINGTSLHGNLLRVTQTEEVPDKKNRQVATSTTPQMIRIQPWKWDKTEWDKTDRLKQLAAQHKVAQTMSNGRREQSPLRSPETPMSSNKSTPRKKRSRSRSGSSSSVPSKSDHEEPTTLDSMSKWVVK